MSRKKKKNESSQTILLFSLLIISIIGIYSLVTFKNVSQEKVDLFASCIADSGAKFYGAFWCSHCRAQKELFGNSKNLPYVECSSPDAKSQLQVCTDAKIEGYPTWVFPNGEQKTGELSFKELSLYSGCQAP